MNQIEKGNIVEGQLYLIRDKILKIYVVDGESKAVNYLICREYELNKTSWSKLQRKYNISRNKIYAASKEKENLEVPNIGKEENKELKQRQLH